MSKVLSMSQEGARSCEMTERTGKGTEAYFFGRVVLCTATSKIGHEVEKIDGKRRIHAHYDKCQSNRTLGKETNLLKSSAKSESDRKTSMIG